MNYRILGDTGIRVSQLCFGALTFGPLQAKLSPDRGGQVLASAISKGINFVDTAQLYGTYEHIRAGMEQSNNYDIVISSKTYAYNKKLAEEAVEEARIKLNRDYIDIFMLHEQESEHTLRGHREALERLLSYKEEGVIKAVGLSAHHIAAVKGAVKYNLDVIHPMINIEGLGIVDGTREEMEEAIKAAHSKGIGVYAMKALGGGNLFKRASECFDYLLDMDCIDSIAVGMQSETEVEANFRYFEKRNFTESQKAKLDGVSRRINIDDWCVGCGACVDKCKQSALKVTNGRASCESEKCVLCGYCSAYCPEWAIKII